MKHLKKTIKLIPHSLTGEEFAPYGQVLSGPTGKPNYAEENWSSLFPLTRAHVPQGELGWVLTKPPKKGFIVSGMEREPEVEVIWPVIGALIHVVALPGDLKNHAEQPNAITAKAFIIKPGQVIIMYPGTWHYVSFPANNRKALYYFLTKDHPREPGWENTPWVPFINNIKVIIENKNGSTFSSM